MKQYIDIVVVDDVAVLMYDDTLKFDRLVKIVVVYMNMYYFVVIVVVVVYYIWYYQWITLHNHDDGVSY